MYEVHLVIECESIREINVKDRYYAFRSEVATAPAGDLYLTEHLYKCPSLKLSLRSSETWMDWFWSYLIVKDSVGQSWCRGRCLFDISNKLSSFDLRSKCFFFWTSFFLSSRCLAQTRPSKKYNADDDESSLALMSDDKTAQNIEYLTDHFPLWESENP